MFYSDIVETTAIIDAHQFTVLLDQNFLSKVKTSDKI